MKSEKYFGFTNLIGSTALAIAALIIGAFIYGAYSDGAGDYFWRIVPVYGLWLVLSASLVYAARMLGSKISQEQAVRAVLEFNVPVVTAFLFVPSIEKIADVFAFSPASYPGNAATFFKGIIVMIISTVIASLGTYILAIIVNRGLSLPNKMTGLLIVRAGFGLILTLSFILLLYHLSS